MNPTNARAELLEAAGNAVLGRREVEYSSPESSFTTVAGIWSAMFGREFTATDVALALAALKLARLATNSAHIDSWVDLAGYAACGFETAGLHMSADES